MEERVLWLASGRHSDGDLPELPSKGNPGVTLKHLVTGADTGGVLSCHLVRLSPGSTIAPHVHEGRWELHEVVEGSGSCRVGETVLAYAPGTLAPLPPDRPHRVDAGPDGLVLRATFTPALL